MLHKAKYTLTQSERRPEPYIILFCLSITKDTFMVAKSTFPDVCAMSDERLNFTVSRLGLHCLYMFPI